MACERNFPAEVPSGCVGELIGKFRDGTLLSDKWDTLELVGQVSGQAGALGKSMTTFGSSPALSSDETPDTLEACCDQLEPLVVEDASRPPSMKANPLIAALLAKLIKLIMDQLLT